MPETPGFSSSSLNYFEALFNKTEENNILLLDTKGIILAINDAFTQRFGYSHSDIIGKHLSILFTEEDKRNGKPEKEIRTSLNTGQAFDNNYLVAKDKSVTWVSGESVLVESSDGEANILKIIQDIQQQKKSETSLDNLNQFSENILSSIEDVVVVLDERMNIIKTNRAFSALFKDVGQHAEKMNFADLIKPHDAFEQVERNIQNAISSRLGFSNISIEIETSNGEKKVFDINCNPMQNTSGENNVLLVIHDITVHKQVEREREDVIDFVAHELRNPLANLVLCNELISEAIKENNPEAAIDILQKSKNNVFRLNKMIAELYDATRINSGNLILDISMFNFGDMIKDAIETIAVLHPSYKIVVKGDGEKEVKGDRYRLIQVVTNYLSNGIKYSNGNTEVVLTIIPGKEKITVSVKDEGAGISPNQLPFLFERFFRAEKTKNLEGIGLGLYLCKQIVHAHRGQVWAESEEGKGSTFYFSIPVS